MWDSPSPCQGWAVDLEGAHPFPETPASSPIAWVCNV